MQLRKTLCSNGTTWHCVSTISNPRHGLSNGNVILLLSCFLANHRASQDLPFLFLINFPVSFDNNVIFLCFIRFQSLQLWFLRVSFLFCCFLFVAFAIFTFHGQFFFSFLFKGPLLLPLLTSTTNFPFLLCFYLFSPLINNFLFSRPYKQFSFFLSTFSTVNFLAFALEIQFSFF